MLPAPGLPPSDRLVVVEKHRDRPLLQGLLRHELGLLLQHPLELFVGGIDPVVRRGDPAQDEGLIGCQVALWETTSRVLGPHAKPAADRSGFSNSPHVASSLHRSMKLDGNAPTDYSWT